MDEEGRNTERRLQRVCTGRETFTLCLLTYDNTRQRDALAAQLAESTRAKTIVELTPDDEASTDALIKRMAIEPGSPGVQVVGAERWPEGLENLAYRLNLARPNVCEQCQGPVVIWLQDDDVGTFLTNAGDFCEFRAGIFEFHKSVVDEAQELTQKEIPADRRPVKPPSEQEHVPARPATHRPTRATERREQQR